MSRLRDRCTTESQRADRLESEIAELVRARERSLVDRDAEQRVFAEQREAFACVVSLFRVLFPIVALLSSLLFSSLTLA